MYVYEYLQRTTICDQGYDEKGVGLVGREEDGERKRKRKKERKGIERVADARAIDRARAGGHAANARMNRMAEWKKREKEKCKAREKVEVERRRMKKRGRCNVT